MHSSHIATCTLAQCTMYFPGTMTCVPHPMRHVLPSTTTYTTCTVRVSCVQSEHIQFLDSVVMANSNLSTFGSLHPVRLRRTRWYWNIQWNCKGMRSVTYAKVAHILKPLYKEGDDNLVYFPELIQVLRGATRQLVAQHGFIDDCGTSWSSYVYQGAEQFVFRLFFLWWWDPGIPSGEPIFPQPG